MMTTLNNLKKIFKHVRYVLEAIPVYILYALFWCLPIDHASYIGGWIAKKIGSVLAANKTARRNLDLVFPSMSEADKKEILNKMWDNLGRLVGEMPHWAAANKSKFNARVKVKKNYTLKTKQGAIFISGHFGNFELASIISENLSLNLNLVYRPANNPFVNYLINRGRLAHKVKLFPKGIAGVRHIQRALIEGGIIGMMVDQKTNDGIDAEFLGHPAKTTSLPAKLAIRYKTPIIFGIVRRTSGANYELVISEPIKIKESESPDAVTQRINDELGKWIKQYPEQWFWVHKRWKS